MDSDRELRLSLERLFQGKQDREESLRTLLRLLKNVEPVHQARLLTVINQAYARTSDCSFLKAVFK